MSLHVYGHVVTRADVAANNMGEGMGNEVTMQKVSWPSGMMHTRVSAGAIRRAIREIVTEKVPDLCNRFQKSDTEAFEFKDPELSSDKDWLDIELFGHMYGKAPSKDGSEVAEEAEEAEKKAAKAAKPKKPKAKKKGKGDTYWRRGKFEVGDAISLTPWSCDSSFNCASPGACLGSKTTGSPDPFKTEIHPARYRYSFCYTPETIAEKLRNVISLPLEAVRDLNHVGGNHSRCPYDYSPESVILRATHDPASRITVAFEAGTNGEDVVIDSLVERCEMGDIDAKEIILGGSITKTDAAKNLQKMGATIPKSGGVKAAFAELESRVQKHLGSLK